jgi:serine/threonine protein kinase
MGLCTQVRYSLPYWGFTWLVLIGSITTDIKLSNVLVNYGKDANNRFADVKLCDLESTVKDDCEYALEGAPIGTAIFRSPEAQLNMRWGTPTDIWSFGAMVSDLISS